MKLREINDLRVKVLIGYVIVAMASIITLLIIIANIDRMIEYAILLMILFMAILIGGIFFVSSKFHEPYKVMYKNWIRTEVLDGLFTIDSFVPTEGFTKEFVESTYFIPRGNIFESDDLIKGSYNGIKFSRSDVAVKRRVKTGKSSTTITYFKGSWTVLEFPKKISSYLFITEKEMFGASGPTGGLFESAPKTSKVKFEDIRFNDTFAVYAEDEHDAFYVLSPSLMERIMELEAEVDGRMMIGLIGNNIHVLFDDRNNSMEPSVAFEITEEVLSDVKKEMSVIIDIIEMLKLKDMR